MNSKKSIFVVGLEGKTHNIHIDKDMFEVSNHVSMVNLLRNKYYRIYVEAIVYIAGEMNSCNN